VVLFVFAGVILAQGDDKPKYTIKEVMKEAHKSGLHKKVAGGKASKEEMEKLVAMYKALTQNKPPAGDAKEWKEQTEAMLTAANAALKGDKAGAAKLLKIVNCKDCHGKFKK
jgi:hypothetical protein